MTTSIDATEKASTPAPPHSTERKRGRRRVMPFLEAYALLILLALVVIFFSLWSRTSETYPTLANFQIILASQSVPAVVGLGALVPLICNEWDLSIGAAAGLAAVVAADLLTKGMSLAPALGVGLGIGLLAGLLNSSLVNFLGTNAVITTLGTAALFDGAITQVTGGTTLISNIPQSMTSFGSSNLFDIPLLFLVLIVVALAVHYLLEYTPLGRHLYAIGSNRGAAVLIGVNIRRSIGIAFVVAGCLAAVGGLMQVARSGAADPRFGDALTLPALAAAFLSAAAVKPGRYNVAGLLVALFLLAAINSGLTLSGASPYVNQYVNGAALIIGVGLAVNLGRRREVA